MARRALQIIGQVMRHAKRTGRAKQDITTEFRGMLRRYKKGHFAAIEIEELPDLVQAIYRNDTRMFKRTLIGIKLILLTFVRTSELIGAKKDEFNFEKSLWIIPAERMKMRLPHIVPLSRQSVSFFQELFSMSGNNELVFPSVTKPYKTMSNATLLSGLDQLGYKGRMTGHGFRALAMSTIKQELHYRHECHRSSVSACS